MPSASARTSSASGPLVRKPVLRLASRGSMAETGLSRVSGGPSVTSLLLFHSDQERVAGLAALHYFDLPSGEGIAKRSFDGPLVIRACIGTQAERDDLRCL